VLGKSSKPASSLWTVSDLGALYVEHKDSLVKYANRFLKNQGQSEEVVQDAVIKVILAAPELNDKEHALAYIRKSIQNLSLDIFRLEGRRPNFIVLDDASMDNKLLIQNHVDHSEVVSAAEDAAVVRQALSLLSSAERAALVMWEIEGRSSKEIARELGIKESSVRHTVSRARASLRRILTELVIDEQRGLTALDLLSNSYKRSAEIVRKSSKASLTLLFLAFAYLGFTNLSDSSSPLDLTKTEVKSASIVKKTITMGISSESKQDSLQSIETSSEGKSRKGVTVRASFPGFAGLDKSGIPTGFTVTDSTGTLGALYFSGKEALLTESGVSIPSLAKTISGAANIFLNQRIDQDSSGTNYEVILSYGRNGAWVPLVSKVISIEIERLMSGNYLLTAVVQVKSEVETTIVIPASTEGRDLEVSPSRVVTRILLNTSKTQILAQAVQVVEKVSR
jgi:RNA polymerase sigma factor (sigma-70 family)